MGNSVSLTGLSTSRTLRLKSMSSELQNLQRQLVTQKKYETLSGFGTQAFRVQDLRAENNKLQTYQENINRVETRMTLMLDSLEKMREIGNEVQDTILTQTREGEVEIEDINNVADINLDYLQDLINTKDGTRYLFAGSDSQKRPMEDINRLVNDMQVQITDWLGGSQTYDQMITNIDSMVDSQFGFSNSLTSAGKTTTKVDDEVSVDYTVLGNGQGFKDLLKGMALSKAMQFPDAAVDIGTEDEFHDLLTYTSNLLASGTEKLKSTSFKLGAEFNLLNKVKEQNTNELNMAQTLSDKLENADPTETIVKIQSLETQLTASYEVTRIMSELSLVNFMR